MDGRHKSPPNALDLTGKRFGKLVAIERAGVVTLKKPTPLACASATPHHVDASKMNELITRARC